jgi:hypothetical protein
MLVLPHSQILDHVPQTLTPTHTRLEVEDEQEEGKKHTGGWCCLNPKLQLLSSYICINKVKGEVQVMAP